MILHLHLTTFFSEDFSLRRRDSEKLNEFIRDHFLHQLEFYEHGFANGGKNENRDQFLMQIASGTFEVVTQRLEKSEHV